MEDNIPIYFIHSSLKCILNYMWLKTWWVGAERVWWAATVKTQFHTWLCVWKAEWILRKDDITVQEELLCMRDLLTKHRKSMNCYRSSQNNRFKVRTVLTHSETWLTPAFKYTRWKRCHFNTFTSKTDGDSLCVVRSLIFSNRFILVRVAVDKLFWEHWMRDVNEAV